MKRILLTFFVFMAFLGVNAQNQPTWVTTWATAPEFTSKGDMPQTCELTGNALR